MELQPFEIVTRNGEFICMQKNSQIHSNGKISMFSGLFLLASACMCHMWLVVVKQQANKKNTSKKATRRQTTIYTIKCKS